ADDGRDRVGQGDADRAADERQRERFGEELDPYVPPSSAERAPKADLANPLVDRDEHDVHHADAADSERERPDEEQQYLKPDGETVDDRTEALAAERLERVLVGRREALTLGERGTHLLDGVALELRRDRRKDEDVRVLCVPHVAGSRVWDPCRVV